MQKMTADTVIMLHYIWMWQNEYFYIQRQAWFKHRYNEDLMIFPLYISQRFMWHFPYDGHFSSNWQFNVICLSLTYTGKNCPGCSFLFIKLITSFINPLIHHCHNLMRHLFWIDFNKSIQHAICTLWFKINSNISKNHRKGKTNFFCNQRKFHKHRMSTRIIKQYMYSICIYNIQYQYWTTRMIYLFLSEHIFRFFQSKYK